MPKSIRFHLDENVDPDIALALRKSGINVTTSQEANLLAESDMVQLKLLCRNGFFGASFQSNGY